MKGQREKFENDLFVCDLFFVKTLNSTSRGDTMEQRDIYHTSSTRMIKVPLSEINELMHVCGPTELKKTGWKGGEYFDNSEWRNYPLKSSEAPLDFTHNEHI